MTVERRTRADRRSQARGGRRDGDHVSPTWLAEHWGVHPNTVYRDIRKGALPAFRMPGGQLRVLLADAKRYGRPVE
jgi:hypothetical protein